jgi:DNA polymerase-1
MEHQPTSARLLIVDGHAYAYRAFHAIQKLNGPDGAPTNAIYGFIKMFSKMGSTLKPSHHCVVWDGGLCAQRMEALPEYKVHRPPMPGDLERQLPEIELFLEAARVPSFVNEGVEADDWIASQAGCAARAGVDVVIASADKDFLQLVSPRVGLLNPNDKSETIWKAEQVRAKTGLAPEQVVDWLSLIGDAVDNIAGVPGVGPKTATDLLKQFGTIEQIYARLGEVKSERIRANLLAAQPAVRRNQKLIQLHTDMPCDFDLPQLVVLPGDPDRLAPLYEKWGFKTMLAQLDSPPGAMAGREVAVGAQKELL